MCIKVSIEADCRTGIFENDLGKNVIHERIKSASSF